MTGAALRAAGAAAAILAAACSPVRDPLETNGGGSGVEDTPPLEPTARSVCVVDGDCLFGQRCIEDRCRPDDEHGVPGPECTGDADCSATFACAPSIGRCVPVAAGDEPAGEGLADCADGATRPCGSKIGECAYGVESCAGGAWTGPCVGGVGPVPEACNGLDDDCDGAVDEAELDGDGDGVRACSGDCDDGDPSVFPGAPEQCDGADDDCDGAVDEGAGVTCDDGFFCTGIEACVTGACAAGLPPDCGLLSDACRAGVCNEGAGGCVLEPRPDGTSCADGDACTEGDACRGGVCAGGPPPGCDDGDPCTADGCVAAGGCTHTPAADGDGDGTRACEGDCDDGAPSIYPGAPERCDGLDNDCDASTPDGSEGDCSAITSGDPCADGVCFAASCIAVDNGTCDSCASGSPTADAGLDQTGIHPDTTVQLDGSGSSDTGGGALTYGWRLVARPSGSSTNINNANAASPTLLGDVTGDFVACLTVTDESGCSSEEDCVTIEVRPPLGLHVELVWDLGSSDVDLHYLASGADFFDTGTGLNGPDCFYERMTPDWGLNGVGNPDGVTINDPRLDVDNITGYGPENINQDQPFDTAGPFTIGVHYFGDKGVTGAVNARVRVFVDGVLELEQSRSLACDELWEVGRIEVSSNGTVVAVQRLSRPLTVADEGFCYGPTAGGGLGGDCCTPTANVSGCSSPSIQSCVCAVDDYCCNDAWDSFCVAEVEDFGCGVCP